MLEIGKIDTSRRKILQRATGLGLTALFSFFFGSQVCDLKAPITTFYNSQLYSAV